MLFNSFEFALFFPIVTVLYFALPHRLRWGWLLLASMIFYASFVPAYLLILFTLIGIDYSAGLIIERARSQRRKKAWLVASIVANVGMLAFFKYFNFLNENLRVAFGLTGFKYGVPNLSIVLPIGLSFHTFQSMSYTIEVYFGRQKAERHLGLYALYVLFYPQMVAGPIERPQNVLPQLHAKHRLNYERVTSGLKLMFSGLFKKMVIADGLALFVNMVYDNPRGATSWELLLATYFFAIQIFCDFSGYSEIALGCARVLGIDLMVNFRRPYLASSIPEFWRRWHISLSTWFRDYVYIPLGGNRVPTLTRYRNVLIVFLVSGLWHGASWTFVVWGLVHAIAMIVTEWLSAPLARLSKGLSATGRAVWHAAGVVVTFHIAVFAWVFFRANSMGDALYVARHLVPTTGFRMSALRALEVAPGQLRLALLLIAGLFAMQLLEERKPLWERLASKPVAVRWAAYYASVAAFAYLLFEQGGAAKAQQFIYFQF
jgi:D-alanyl-lipoteichoic acid acyltransferase DltB (MBOAT superfamily)